MLKESVMEITKISFKSKEDVKKQWPLDDEWFETCNYDCTEWFLKTLGDKYASSTSPCYTAKTAKTSIWH